MAKRLKWVEVDENEAKKEKEPGKLKKAALGVAKGIGLGLLAGGAFLVGKEYQKSEAEEEAAEDPEDLNIPDN